MQKHIIHRQKVLLEIPGEKDVFGYQNTVSKLFNNGLQDEINSVLNAMCVDDWVIRIDKLQLNLGIINGREFEMEFKNKFIDAFKAQVSKDKANAEEKEVIIIKPAESQQQAFLYFLRHGTLPWYSQVSNIPAWEEELLKQLGLDEWRTVINWLRIQIDKGNEVLQRLGLQFSNAFLAVIAQYWHQSLQHAESVEADMWLQWHKDILQVSKKMGLKNSISREGVWRNIFLSLWQTGELDSNAIVERTIGQILVNYEPGELSNYSSELLLNIETNEVLAVFTKMISLIGKEVSIQRIAAYMGRGKLDILLEADRLENIDDNFNKHQEDYVNNHLVSSGMPEALSKSDNINISEREEVIYADNCGLVLLHPFLAPYFTGLGLMHNKQFVNEEAQQRAILLLFYLATGETEVAEFSLVLQKVLCGYNVEDTLATSIVLSPLQQEESAKLLRSVIDYWPPLKNTSIEGFRDAFMKRTGRLSITNNGWLLRVEQKTVDILLGKLPWGFSTIRLPWMQQMINVEWA